MEKAGNISKIAKKGAETTRRRVRVANLQAKIDALCLMDDLFFRKCLEKARDCVEYIVRQILGDDSLVVKEFSTQRTIANLQGRSATLDVYAVDSNNREINIEIQNDLKEADVRRARWYSALLDANNLAAGEDPRSLRDSYVIFITRGDYFHSGEEYSDFVRTNAKSGAPLNDGTHIIYINAKSKSDTRIGRLVHDLTCANPDEFHSKILAKQVKRFKKSKEGSKTMSSIFEKERAEGHAEGCAEGEKRGAKKSMIAAAKRMLKMGKLALKDIALYSGLALKEVQALAAANGGRKVAAL